MRCKYCNRKSKESICKRCLKKDRLRNAAQVIMIKKELKEKNLT